jgi:hypothetical protein
MQIISETKQNTANDKKKLMIKRATLLGLTSKAGLVKSVEDSKTVTEQHM